MQSAQSPSPVESAKLIWTKRGDLSEEIALFVTHAPKGLVKPHVPLYLKALQSVGIQTITIVATDDPDSFDTAPLEQVSDQLMVRQNIGYDFAAWAHAAKLINISASRTVYLLNDSIVGPTNQSDFERVIARVRQSNAEFISISESGDVQRHAQSYFLSFKGRGVEMLRDYLAKVQNEVDKFAVIKIYEFGTLAAAKAGNYRHETLYHFADLTHANPTIFRWRELLEAGFPFIKGEMVRRLPATELVEEFVQNPTLMASVHFLIHHYGSLGPRHDILVLLPDGRPEYMRRKRASRLKYYLYRSVAALLRQFSKEKAYRFEVRATKYYPAPFEQPLNIFLK